MYFWRSNSGHQMTAPFETLVHWSRYAVARAFLPFPEATAWFLQEWEGR